MRARIPLASLALLAVLASACAPRAPQAIPASPAMSPRDFDALARQSLARIEGTFGTPGLRAPVEVLRDEWGIPHIYARNLHDLFFAQGYVQAQDRLWQMDMWRRINEGRLAEILGAEYVRHDRLARLLRFRGSWEEEYARYHPQGEMIFQAFADGVNAYIAGIGDDLPAEYRLTGLRPLPWRPEASTGRVATALPLGDARAELRLAREIAEDGIAAVNREEGEGVANWIELEVPEGLDPSIITDDVVAALGGFESGFPEPPLLPEYRSWPGAVTSPDLGARSSSPGSNNWVVSGELTATGEVLLANDPHRSVENPSLRYLVHLDAPGYSVIGATEPAIPGVAIGHNGKVGWGLTIVGIDQADVFVERLDPGNLDRALWRGEWYPLEIVVDTIPVRGEAARIVEHRYSRHGPVFYVDSANHVAYALRTTSSEPGGGGYLGGIRLGEVDDCHEFIAALHYWQAPDENMICGDVAGNIAWLAAGLAPRRSGDDWYGRLPVPGTGDYTWDGFRAHTEHPQELNPERGWIATANHDIQPPGFFPPLMFRDSSSTRWTRLRQIFGDTAGLSADDFERIQHDAVHPWFAGRDLPLLRGWTSDDADVEWARSLLVAWDGIYDKDVAAPALHEEWRDELSDEARDPDVAQPRRQALSEAALAQAVETLRDRLGEDRSEWRWGRINRSEFPHTFVAAYDLPAVERDGNGGTIADAGATFREIIDFANFDNSRVTSTPGQSMQPGSPFYGDLLPLWGDERYVPLLYTRPAVEAATAFRLVLEPAGTARQLP
ncbi:MAG: penicillin acylase family protein [Longimicrobiales bacterium]